MASLIAALTAIKEIIELGRELLTLYREAKDQGWIEEGQKLTQAIKGAKTDDERKALARKLFHHNVSVPR